MKQTFDEKYVTHSWTLASGETGEALAMSQFADKTVQVFGTFSTGSVSLEGSMDGTNWAALTNDGTNALTFTGGAIKSIMENPRFLRPVATTVTSVTVIVGTTGVLG